MPLVCSVKFPYAARDLWFDPNGLDPQRGQNVICETERGQEYGLVTGASREVDDATLELTTGGSALRPLLRLATVEDDAYAEELDDLAEEAMAEFQAQVEELGLEMKPVGVEFLFGGEGAVCYFIADNRVDFRQLARNLSRSLHAKVDLRQIGVREQASIMGGLAHCGQEYCCSRLGQGFGPVTIRMAKDQDLPLNTPKISGACGRLMCCLRYEDEAYRDFKKRAPRKNAQVETPFGPAKVSEFDTPRETVGLRLEDNRTIRVPLACMECSDAARERAERDGNLCRPDCVSFEALERLESPQVKLALAQLRAETELTEEPWLPKEDILQMEEDVPEPPKRSRRRHGRGGSSGATEAKAQDDRASRGRRRRRGRLDASAKAPAKGDAPASSKASETDGAAEPREGKAHSRRRHHSQQSGQGRQQRRPRQRSANAQKSKRPADSKVQGDDAAEKPASKPKRHRSNDRQGNQAQQREQAKRAGESKQRPPKAQGGAGAAEDRKPGRARRRRRRHGGGGNASGGNASGGNASGGNAPGGNASDNRS